MFKTNEKNNVEGTPSREVKTTTANNDKLNDNATISKHSIISEGIKIKGEVAGSNNLDVYGSVEGNINLDSNNINIENTADVKADIVGKVVRINGKVVGNIEAKEKILVTSSGNVKGDIKAPKVELQDGSYFDGNISMEKGSLNTSNNNTIKATSSTGSIKPTTNTTNK